MVTIDNSCEYSGKDLRGLRRSRTSSQRENPPQFRQAECRDDLERQFDDTQPVPNEDCISVLPDVTERAKEVIPGQHCSRIHLSPPHSDAVLPSRWSFTTHNKSH